MKSKERRKEIKSLLKENLEPIKGTDLAEKFSVTRQVIVKDIAILRAEGNAIIATPDGYLFNNESRRNTIILAVNHNEDRLCEELEIVVKYGGIIEDVIVEHPLYGDLKGNLRIKNLNELNKFVESFNSKKAKPLSALTNGVHLHTISADTREDLEAIRNELKEK